MSEHETKPTNDNEALECLRRASGYARDLHTSHQEGEEKCRAGENEDDLYVHVQQGEAYGEIEDYLETVLKEAEQVSNISVPHPCDDCRERGSPMCEALGTSECSRVRQWEGRQERQSQTGESCLDCGGQGSIQIGIPEMGDERTKTCGECGGTDYLFDDPEG